MIFSPFAFQNYAVTGPSLDADASAYLAKIVSVGGTVNATINGAVNTLFVSLKSNNLYTELLHIYPFVGATPASHAIEAKSLTDAKKITWGRGLANARAHISDGVWSNQDQPIRGSTSTEFGNLGLSPANIHSSINNVSFGAYVHAVTFIAVQDWKDMLIIDSSSNQVGGTQRYSMHIPTAQTGTFTPSCYSFIGNSYNFYDDGANPIGFWVCSRTSATNLQLYKNGTSKNTSTVDNTGASLHPYPIQFFAGFSDYNAHVGITSFLYLGNGLSATQVSSLNTIVQAFETTLGRNV